MCWSMDRPSRSPTCFRRKRAPTAAPAATTSRTNSWRSSGRGRARIPGAAACPTGSACNGPSKVPHVEPKKKKEGRAWPPWTHHSAPWAIITSLSPHKYFKSNMPNTEFIIFPSKSTNNTTIYPVIEVRNSGDILASLFFFTLQLLINRKFREGINLQWQTPHK